MSWYQEQYEHPLADLSVFEESENAMGNRSSGTIHVLPPKDAHGDCDVVTTNSDGQPATHDYALDTETVRAHSDLLPDELQAQVESTEYMGTDLLRTIGEYFAHEEEAVPCNKCGKMIWVMEWAGKYARNKCKECAGKCSKCGASLKETKVMVERRASARIGNKYKCDPDEGGCGRTWRGISTG